MDFLKYIKKKGDCVGKSPQIPLVIGDKIKKALGLVTIEILKIPFSAEEIKVFNIIIDYNKEKRNTSQISYDSELSNKTTREVLNTLEEKELIESTRVGNSYLWSIK
jgi:hypothetical protein